MTTTINQKIRLKYIDAFIGVNGFFVRKYAEETFQISTPQSSRDLCEYRDLNPNAPYSHTQKSTVPNEKFQMVFFKEKAEAEIYLRGIADIFESKEHIGISHRKGVAS
mgnify:CR=1 FL=1